jgi:hypothetical protein
MLPVEEIDQSGVTWAGAEHLRQPILQQTFASVDDLRVEALPRDRAESCRGRKIQRADGRVAVGLKRRFECLEGGESLLNHPLIISWCPDFDPVGCVKLCLGLLLGIALPCHGLDNAYLQQATYSRGQIALESRDF